MNEHHRQLQNILWRDDPNKPICCLQLQTVTYGLKSSTFLTTRCLIELADKYQDKFPLAALAMRENTYVDDIIAGADNVEQLVELKKQLIELLKLGNFVLHKWTSNNMDILCDIPIGQQYFEDIDFNKDNVIKTLGIKYEILSDSLSFSCPLNTNSQQNTKRKVLSFIGKIYDPLGLISPVVVVAKLVMQEIWAHALSWDSLLPDDLLKKWSNFVINLDAMGKVTIPRSLGISSKFSNIELIGYADASLKAFGCVLYIRVCHEDRAYTHLLCSKSRVAPLSKNLTIPQLELNSALLLAQLAYRVSKILESRIKFKTFLYSDSQITLSWIGSKGLRTNIYNKNKVGKILELSNNMSWHFVRTASNPADFISRGIDPRKLQSCELWWYGPDCLNDVKFFHVPYNDCLDSASFLAECAIGNSNEMDVTCLVSKVEPCSADLFQKYSNFYKLQRIIA